MIRYFENGTGSRESALDLARGYGDTLKHLMLAMQEDATLGLAQSAPRIAIAEKKLGRPLLMKITCAVIKMLDYSLSLTFELTSIQVFECAQLYLDKYRAESVQDLILCLRLLKQGDLRDEKGNVLKIYNRLDAATLGEWMWAYANWKIDQLDEYRRQQRSSQTKETASLIGTLAAAMPEELKQSLLAMPTKANRQTPDLPTITHEQYLRWLQDNAETVDFEVIEQIGEEAERVNNKAVLAIVKPALEKRQKIV